ncbi:MAG: hypothetical protein LWW86_06745 [Micrococcales bacterium]|nr:hypothetical protein [Micrococcales bacterium]
MRPTALLIAAALLVGGCGTSTAPAEPSVTATAAGAVRADEFAGGAALPGGLTAPPGTALAAPAGQAQAGGTSAAYATLVLRQGTSAEAALRTLQGQLTGQGYAADGGASGLTTRWAKGSSVVDLSGGEATDEVPGFVSVIVSGAGS